MCLFSKGSIECQSNKPHSAGRPERTSGYLFASHFGRVRELLAIGIYEAAKTSGWRLTEKGSVAEVWLPWQAGRYNMLRQADLPSGQHSPL